MDQALAERQLGIEGLEREGGPLVWAVRREALGYWWVVAREWIVPALKRGLDGGQSEATVRERILEGRYLLLMAARTADSADAALMLECDATVRPPVLYVVAAGGRRGGALRQLGPALFTEVKRLARDLGCRHIRSIGRKGWGRWMAANVGRPASAVQIIWQVELEGAL
jgi:hypothetical protein